MLDSYLSLQEHNVSTVFMTGSHPRHAAMARAVAQSGSLTALVIEEREVHVPAPPLGLAEDLTALFNTHFERRASSEDHFFGRNGELPDVPTLCVTREELNSPKVLHWLEQYSPDLLLSYGVHILTPGILATARRAAWNIHGGLSPWYRGTATHFWPSYLLQPQFTGMTLHDTIASVDAGAIVHQSAAELVRGDGLHDLSCRAVLSLMSDISAVITKFYSGVTLEKKPQTTSGRIWRTADWRPDHLRLIYEHFNDSVVNYYLDGRLQHEDPSLYRQL